MTAKLNDYFCVYFNTHTGKIKLKKYDGVCIKLKSVLVPSGGSIKITRCTRISEA